MLPTLLISLFSASTLKVGDVAPDFTTQDTDGNVLQLDKLVEQGPVVLAFFPMAFTPG